MMTNAFPIKPPRIAVWFVNLFTPHEQAESIPGDLLEEFSDLASKSGEAFARRWYWRHSVTTIAYLIVSGFRSSPWRIAVAVLLGHLLLLYGLMLPERIIVAVLRIYPIYPNYDHKNVFTLWMFWVPLAIQIGWVLTAMLVGCIVAMAVKGREMVATMALGLTSLALRLVGLIFPQTDILVFIVAFVVGGGIVRKVRSVVSSRRSTNYC